MALLDLFFGSAPEPYDWRADPLARISERETKMLSAHVKECLRRWVDLQTTIGHLKVEQSRQNRLLWFVIALLVANKVIDVGAIAALLK